MVRDQRRSILCPNCRKLISKDESQCPYCGMRRPGLWQKGTGWTRLFSGTGQPVRILISINIGMFLLSLLLYPESLSLSFNPLSLFSPENKSLLVLGATGVIPIDRLHRWWTLLSANYLHGGLFHILFNMVALWQIAQLVLREYGAYRMVIIYTLSGVTGFWVSYVAGIAFTIGASCAVCGLIGAALYFGKSRGGIYGQTLYKQIGAWAIGIFLFGFLVPGINNWGHGGGIFAGLVLGFLLGYREKRREGVFHKIAAIGCVGLTLLVLGWAVVSGIAYRVSG